MHGKLHLLCRLRSLSFKLTHFPLFHHTPSHHLSTITNHPQNLTPTVHHKIKVYLYYNFIHGDAMTSAANGTSALEARLEARLMSVFEDLGQGNGF